MTMLGTPMFDWCDSQIDMFTRTPCPRVATGITYIDYRGTRHRVAMRCDKHAVDNFDLYLLRSSLKRRLERMLP